MYAAFGPGVPVALLADFSQWQVETDDLSKLDEIKQIKRFTTEYFELVAANTKFENQLLAAQAADENVLVGGLKGLFALSIVLAIVLMDHLLRHRAQNMDVESATPTIPAAPAD